MVLTAQSKVMVVAALVSQERHAAIFGPTHGLSKANWLDPGWAGHMPQLPRCNERVPRGSSKLYFLGLRAATCGTVDLSSCEAGVFGCELNIDRGQFCRLSRTPERGLGSELLQFFLGRSAADL